MGASPIHGVYWQRAGVDDAVDSLRADAVANTIIVGGGVAGLLCAQQLCDAGQSVILLERDRCGSGASGRSSGFLTPDSELELTDLIRNRGNEYARQLWEFALSGVLAIKQAVQRHAIDCDIIPLDSLLIANSARGMRSVRDEHAARLRLGYESRFYGPTELHSVIGSESFRSAVRCGGTFGIDAYAFCRGLSAALREKSVRIFERTPVHEVSAGRVRAGMYTVSARNIVVCTDCSLPELQLASEDIYRVQTFLAVTQPLPDDLRRRLFPDQPVMIWDTDVIYQYLRPTVDGRLLIGASSLADTYSSRRQQTPHRILRKMRGYLREHFPWLPVDFEYAWPGQIGVTRDFVPLADTDPRTGVHFAGGAAGLPWAAALGRLTADRILGRPQAVECFFKTQRAPVQHCLARGLGKPAAFALSHAAAKYLH